MVIIISLKKIKVDFCGGEIHAVKYLANKYSGKKVTYAPYKEADYVMMINTLSTDINKKSSCYSIHPGKDIVAVNRLGVKLSVLRKLEKLEKWKKNRKIEKSKKSEKFMIENKNKNKSNNKNKNENKNKKKNKNENKRSKNKNKNKK